MAADFGGTEILPLIKSTIARRFKDLKLPVSGRLLQLLYGKRRIWGRKSGADDGLLSWLDDEMYELVDGNGEAGANGSALSGSATGGFGSLTALPDFSLLLPHSVKDKSASDYGTDKKSSAYSKLSSDFVPAGNGPPTAYCPRYTPKTRGPPPSATSTASFRSIDPMLPGKTSKLIPLDSSFCSLALEPHGLSGDYGKDSDDKSKAFLAADSKYFF